jgi:drug/metabolite transporter (DMT)-like permease
VGVLLGLLVAASFGSGDFLGGLASRWAPLLYVLSLAQVAALALALAAVVVFGGTAHANDVAFGVGAGVLNVVAVGCLYRGLAVGQMSQVAPVAAVIGAILPVTWGAIRGEPLGVLVWLGVGLAIVASGFLSWGPEEHRGESFAQGLLLAAAAGIGFGLSFIFFAAASHHGGMWPVLSARVAAAIAVGGVTLWRRPQGSFASMERAQAVCAGALDVSATMLLVFTLRSHFTAVIAPVASLAPAFTAGHARWYLHERTSSHQKIGLVLGLTGLALIATG